ncbi:PilN domain-containing protein [Geomonas sp. RF6]|uniref:PilN domain-containing protein n=1 Tax=Geomonas sp. RF6 TaxID=2897342 RepID=UPI001E3A4133|nr:PilN domain-containing protein [Geomonas sp. RF6]UFS70872.1 PilN domain-containing protein [Geomonas sp. RF6]
MRVKINLATRRYVNTRGVNGAIAAAILILLAALLFQIQDAAFRAGEIKRLKGATEAAAAKSGRTPQVSEQQYRALTTQIDAANKILSLKSVQWIPLLDQLEAVVPEGVALSSVEPEVKSNTVKVGGVSRSFSQLRTLLENLERSSYFSEVYLLTQQQTKVGLTQRGVTFTLTAKVKQP